jgi:hypothetical protein
MTNSGVDIRGIARAFVRTSATKGPSRAPRRSSSSSSRTRCRPSRTARSSRSCARRRSPISSRTSGRRKRSSPPTSTRSTSATAPTGSSRRPRPTSATTSTTSAAARPATRCASKQLQPWEAALLAGIIQSPTAYRPGDHPDGGQGTPRRRPAPDARAGLPDQAIYEESIKQALPAPRRSRRPRSRRSKGSTPATSRAGCSSR